jgi:hypothetical protein
MFKLLEASESQELIGKSTMGEVHLTVYIQSKYQGNTGIINL